MKICICGGGALGHVCTAVFASQGHEVSVLTNHPVEWENILRQQTLLVEK